MDFGSSGTPSESETRAVHETIARAIPAFCAAALATGAAPPEFCERPADVDGACAVASSRLRGLWRVRALLVEPALHAPRRRRRARACTPRAGRAPAAPPARRLPSACALGPGAERANARSEDCRRCGLARVRFSPESGARSEGAVVDGVARDPLRGRGRDDLLSRDDEVPGPALVRGRRGNPRVGCDRARRCRRVSRPRATSPRAWGGGWHVAMVRCPQVEIAPEPRTARAA